MIAEFENQVSQTLEEIKSQGLFKTERIITTPPGHENQGSPTGGTVTYWQNDPHSS
jgi:hypothetical protein